MRREQLGELVDLTSQLPAQRRTAEMPAVDLVDLLRKDRELDGRRPVTAEHFATSVRFHLTERHEAPRTAEIAVGTSRFPCPSRLKLALGCVAAFASGFALTIPLWW